jgi:hypothetical protein
VRENREAERQYLANLHDEILVMIENNKLRVTAAKGRLAALDSIAERFAGRGEDSDLTTQHCVAITSSHIFVGRIYGPPTIEELLSTGRLQLITNAALRSEIVSYSQVIESYRQLNDDIQSDRLVLSRKYPSLIVLDLQDDDIAECDFVAMEKSASFRNDFADNSYRHQAYVNNIVVGQQDLRHRLHDALDQELSVSHSEPALHEMSDDSS